MSQSQVQSRDKRWIDRAACLSIIADKLKELGHEPDYVSADALAELVRRAAGSEQSLRAGLAGALFLAATDDAPCVERTHVERAFPEEPADLPLVAGKYRARWPLPCAAVALAASVMLFHQKPKRSPPHSSQTHAVPVHSSSSQGPRMPPTPAPKLQPPPLTSLPHPSAAPVLQATISRPIEIALPVGPQALIRLLTTPHSDPAPLLERLRKAGITPVVEQITPGPPGGNEVLYYFVEDGVLAERIAHEAQEVETAPLQQPRLVQPPQSALRPPGSVDILLRQQGITQQPKTSVRLRGHGPQAAALRW